MLLRTMHGERLTGGPSRVGFGDEVGVSGLVTLPKYSAKGSELRPGNSLGRGDALVTKNGGVLLMQKEGNLVLYGPNGKGQHTALWWTHDHATPAVKATMDADGGLVLRDANGRANYSSNDARPAGRAVRIIFQDDGNLVWYDAAGKPVLSSVTAGWHINSAFEPKDDNIVGSIVKVVASPITAPLAAVAKITEKIPVVGDITKIVNTAASGPANLAAAIASGARIDKAVIGNLKEQLKNVKDAAPYAQTIVSFVPGVGAGVAAAIGAGAALAEGKSIDEIAKAAVRGAIPGGAIAQAAFDTAVKVASGENVAQSVLEGARSALPPAAQKAYDIGVAVATGEKIQNALANGLLSLAPAQIKELAAVGQKAIGTIPGLAQAAKSVASGAATEGFQVAAGLLSQSGINEKALAAAKSKLSSEAAKGFDAALASQEGHLAWLQNVRTGATRPPGMKAPPPPVSRPPASAPPAMRAPLKPVIKAASPASAVAVAKKVMDAAQSAVVASTIPPIVVGPAASVPAPAVLQTLTKGVFPPYPRVAAGALSGCGDPDTTKWGAPFEVEGGPMGWAARSAVNGTRGKPRKVEGPDGITYLFSVENGVLTGRKAVG